MCMYVYIYEIGVSEPGCNVVGTDFCLPWEFQFCVITTLNGRGTKRREGGRGGGDTMNVVDDGVMFISGATFLPFLIELGVRN